MASPVPVVQLTGPLLVGYEINWGLYGLLCMQVYVYNQAYASLPDSKGTKLLVYGLWIWETAQTILATYDSFYHLALGWGDLDELQAANVGWFQVPIMIGISSAVIQCFYAWRIYLLGKSKILAIFIVLLALIQGSAAIAEGSEVLMGSPGNVGSVQVLAVTRCTVWLAGTAICDATICISMLYFLVKSRTGFHRTDMLINRLIVIIIETGMATALVAIADLTLFLVFKYNFYHIAVALALSKLYANSLMVLLNSRITISPRNLSSMVDLQPAPRRYRRSAGINIKIENGIFTDGVAMVKLTGQTTSHNSGALHTDDGTGEY